MLASILLLLTHEGVEAQGREDPFSGIAPPTPQVPPAASGMLEIPLQSPGQETGPGEPNGSPLPGMALGATLGSLAGTATGVLSYAAYCQEDCDYDTILALFAAGWIGGTAGSAIGVWTAGNEDGVTGGDAVLASLAGAGAGIVAGFGWGFPLVQGITTGVVANLLRD